MQVFHRKNTPNLCVLLEQHFNARTLNDCCIAAWEECGAWEACGAPMRPRPETAKISLSIEGWREFWNTLVCNPNKLWCVSHSINSPNATNYLRASNLKRYSRSDRACYLRWLHCVKLAWSSNIANSKVQNLALTGVPSSAIYESAEDTACTLYRKWAYDQTSARLDWWWSWELVAVSHYLGLSESHEHPHNWIRWFASGGVSTWSRRSRN